MTSIRALRAHRQRPVHAALQTDRGRLRYIEDLACAQPQPVHDGAETPSTISLKQASTIAEMRIQVSRSFGKAVNDEAGVVEAVSEFACRAAEKLRQQGSVAGALQVFIRTSPFRENDRQHSPSTVIPLRPRLIRAGS